MKSIYRSKLIKQASIIYIRQKKMMKGKERRKKAKGEKEQREKYIKMDWVTFFLFGWDDIEF